MNHRHGVRKWIRGRWMIVLLAPLEITVNTIYGAYCGFCDGVAYVRAGWKAMSEDS